MDSEVPLPGGRITTGVVRVENTVRRPATASSPFVAELLGDLRRQGFAGAPRHLGFDTGGREILSYLPGRVPTRFRRWSDPQVAAAGRLLRAFHDATRDSRLTGRHPVVCHHDPGPNNTVFVDGVPAAFIDFDTAAPGDPLEDLGYMAWTWCISSRPGAPSATAQASQLRVLADAYGLGAASPPASSTRRSTVRPATPGGGTATSRARLHGSRPTTRSPSASGGRSASTPTPRPTARSSMRPWAGPLGIGGRVQPVAARDDRVPRRRRAAAARAALVHMSHREGAPHRVHGGRRTKGPGPSP